MHWFSIGITFQDNENVPQEGEVIPITVKYRLKVL